MAQSCQGRDRSRRPALPSGAMTHRHRRLDVGKRPGWSATTTGVLLTALVGLVGCGQDRDEPRPADTARSSPSTMPSAPPTSSTAATPSTPASGHPHTLAELARQPCLALGPEDAVELGVIMDPSVLAPSEKDLNGKSCQWWTPSVMVSFTPYPSTDQTTSADVAHLTKKTIAGHRAVLGDARGGCLMYVAAGTRQSFRLITSPPREGDTGPEVCALSTAFATTILGRLR